MYSQKFKLTLVGNRLAPGREVELDADRILGNDIRLPGERHPYQLRLWVIGNEYGALGAVWATNETDALDELIDSGLGDGLLIAEEDVKEEDEVSRAGNAGEPVNLDNAWMNEVEFDRTRDFELLMAFAEARGAGYANLGKL